MYHFHRVRRVEKIKVTLLQQPNYVSIDLLFDVWVLNLFYKSEIFDNINSFLN